MKALRDVPFLRNRSASSALIHDIKGENWALTLETLPVPEARPDRSGNGAVQPALRGGRGPNEVRDVQTIADIPVDPDGTLLSVLRDGKKDGAAKRAGVQSTPGTSPD
jgi:hypothetical protein